MLKLKAEKATSRDLFWGFKLGILNSPKRLFPRRANEFSNSTPSNLGPLMGVPPIVIAPVCSPKIIGPNVLYKVFTASALNLPIL